MSLKIDLVRPDDLLNLRIETVNLHLDVRSREKPFLAVADSNQPAYLIVVFPPQSIEETAYFENSVVPSAQNPAVDVPVQPGVDDTKTDPETRRAERESQLTTSEPLDPPGVIVTATDPKKQRKAVAKIANTSRLVFKVPPNIMIPYSVQGLLNWSKLELQVNPIAAIGDNPTPDQINSAPAIQEPKQTETALELPYQLIVSPTNQVKWTHRSKPFTTKGRTELWHTRLLLNKEKGPVELSRENRAPLRAIWSNYPQYNPNQRPDPTAPDPDLIRTAINNDDRWQIVILTSAFHGYEVETEFILHPILAKSPLKKATVSTKKVVATDLSANIATIAAVCKYTFEGPYIPRPFYAEQLMLSSLGGWLRSRGNWTPPHKAKEPPIHLVKNFHKAMAVLQKPPVARETVNPAVQPDAMVATEATPNVVPMMLVQTIDLGQLDLSEWVHVATQGRDHYVRIVYEGELWPFRHGAALIKVTERKFEETGAIVGAYLMQRMFIVVREPEKQFNERGSPFKMVRLTTTVTPDIADPDVISGTTRSFWVEVTTPSSPRDMFRFHAVGKDWSDNLVDFTIPLMFVSISDLPDANPNKTILVRNAYNASAKVADRDAYLFGQKVAFTTLRNVEVDQANNNTQQDNTRLVTEKLNFVVDALGNQAKMLTAEVKIPQIQDLLGGDASTIIRYYQDYVQNGFDQANEVFAQITSLDPNYKPEEPFGGLLEKVLGLNFTSDQAGGFATPNMNISTLTRKLGPIAGDVANALTDAFDPKDFFKDVTAQLFGAFNLVDLLVSTLADATASMGKNAPKLKTETTDILQGKLLKATLDWEPTIQPVDLTIVAFKNQGKDGTPSKLAIHGLIQKTVELDNVTSPPSFQLTGKLTDFVVTILDSVAVNFTEFSFAASDGKKPDVSVKLYPDPSIEFMGDLQFVEELRKAIPPGLFGSGASLDVTATGIKAGFAFAVPPISVGVFALRDLSLGAAVTLPFLDGKPTFDFNISERHHPFLLAVYFFGGTGFFRLQLDTLGMRELEAALEFGATASIDLGVASGEAHIMAGIYFSLQRKDSGQTLATLTGYMRLGGSLSVLGLIRVSVEFNLSFTYQNPPSRAYGRATLTIEVDLLFFSISVELTVERSFGGSAPADPPFGQMFTDKSWEDYALAFA
jgi:hypothetical protein